MVVGGVVSGVMSGVVNGYRLVGGPRPSGHQQTRDCFIFYFFAPIFSCCFSTTFCFYLIFHLSHINDFREREECYLFSPPLRVHQI